MSKRSNFPRCANDQYYTPFGAVVPLIPHIRDVATFAEPCCGDGRLVRHLHAAGKFCVYQADIDPRFDLFAPSIDALNSEISPCDAIITNPPWTRKILHPLIQRWMQHAPTWLLFDAGWMHSHQARPMLPHCSHIVSVGRVKWFGNIAGMDDAAWYRFSVHHTDGPHFYGR